MAGNPSKSGLRNEARRGSLVSLPGSRQTSARVVILTRDSILDVLGEVTVAPITSTIRDIPTEVVLGPPDGMPRACAVNLDHVQTVAKARLEGRVTALGERRMSEIRAALLFALGW